MRYFTAEVTTDQNGDFAWTSPTPDFDSGDVVVACRAQLAELGSEVQDPNNPDRQAFLCEGTTPGQNIVSQASFGGQFVANNQTGTVALPCPWELASDGRLTISGNVGSALAGFPVQIYLAVAEDPLDIGPGEG